MGSNGIQWICYRHLEAFGCTIRMMWHSRRCKRIKPSDCLTDDFLAQSFCLYSITAIHFGGQCHYGFINWTQNQAEAHTVMNDYKIRDTSYNILSSSDTGEQA